MKVKLINFSQNKVHLVTMGKIQWKQMFVKSIHKMLYKQEIIIQWTEPTIMRHIAVFISGV